MPVRTPVAVGLLIPRWHRFLLRAHIFLLVLYFYRLVYFCRDCVVLPSNTRRLSASQSSAPAPGRGVSPLPAVEQDTAVCRAALFPLFLWQTSCLRWISECLVILTGNQLLVLAAGCSVIETPPRDIENKGWPGMMQARLQACPGLLFVSGFLLCGPCSVFWLWQRL